MEIDRLVTQITDIIMARLSAGEEQKVAEPLQKEHREQGTGRIFKGVLVLTESRDQMEEFWEQMRACTGLPIEWLAFAGPEFPLSVAEKSLNPLKIKCFDTLPPAWKSIASSSDFLMVPVLNLNLCSKIASLIADDVPSKLVLQFLLEKKQILAGAEEYNFLTRFSAQLPKPLVNVMNTHFEMIRSLGIQEVEMKNLEREMGSLISRTGLFGKGNNVITKEDIMAAIEEGKNRLEFLRGTIITPLARAYAEEMSVEIVLR